MEIREAFGLFKSTQHVAQNTLAGYQTAINSLVEFGIVDTKMLTRAHLSEWIAARVKADVCPQTVNTQLGGILSIASTLERCGRFPLKRLEQIRRLRIRGVVTPEPRYLSRDEVARLRVAARSVDEQLDLAVAFAVFAGLRMSELRRLHSEDLSLEGEAPFLRVLRSRGETKTKKSRSAPIAKAFAAQLKSLELPAGPVFPPAHPNNPGQYLSRETLREWLATARQTSGLHHATWFVLRHTFASYLRQSGVELSLISGFMGNTTRIAEKFYSAMGPGGNRLIEKGFSSDPAA